MALLFLTFLSLTLLRLFALPQNLPTLLSLLCLIKDEIKAAIERKIMAAPTNWDEQQQALRESQAKEDAERFAADSRRVLYVVVLRNQSAGAAQFQQPGGDTPKSFTQNP